MKPVFSYLNYREFLRDFYLEKKAKHSFYSYRLFAQKAGFAAGNFLKLVIDGDRNLSKDSVFKFSRALGLNKKESEYFEHLVFFNQSDTLEEKNFYLTKVMKFRRISDPAKLEESEYRYYSAWYHPVVRELATAIDFKEDFRRLGQMVVPAISASEAEKSVGLLVNLDFIRRLDDGRYEKTSASLTTGPQVRSVAVANYHKAMLQRAAESIERFPAEKRDITSLTLGISEKTYEQLRERVRLFRKELLELAESDSTTEKVVQMNFQVFPLSESFGNVDGGAR